LYGENNNTKNTNDKVTWPFDM